MIAEQQTSPMIGRRLLLRNDHIAMGWRDCHLHRFHIHGKDYGITNEGCVHTLAVISCAVIGQTELTGLPIICRLYCTLFGVCSDNDRLR